MRHLVLLASLLSLLNAAPAQATLKVVTSTTDIAALVRIVGGDEVEVESLCRGYQDPHYLEAKPSHMSRLRRADLMAYVGLELEVGWMPLLVKGARNPALRDGEPANLNCSAGISVLEVPTGQLSRSEGDVHPLGNPHYWLDPRNQIVMASTIADRLTELDPAHAATFGANRDAFAERMNAAIAGWEQRLAGWRGRSIVCYHKQWEYLLDWLGIDVLDYIEAKPGIPPSPKHIAQLRAAMERENVHLVLISNFFEPAPARRVAADGEAELVILPASVEGVEGLDDPFAYFDYVVDHLARFMPPDPAVPQEAASE